MFDYVHGLGYICYGCDRCGYASLAVDRRAKLMCDCGEVKVLVSSQILVVCAGCGKKKAEKIIHLDLSSNEVGQSSNKVPEVSSDGYARKVPVEDKPKKPCIHSVWGWHKNSYGWLQKRCIDCCQSLGGTLKGEEAIAKAEEYDKEYGHIPDHFIEYLQKKELWLDPEDRPIGGSFCYFDHCKELESECGDCHNVYPERCSERELYGCWECAWDGVVQTGRKLRPGEKSWKEKVAERESKDKAAERDIAVVGDIAIVCDDLSGAGGDLVDKIAQEPSEPCSHENIVWERNSYRKYQRRCGDCKQWLPGSFPATVPMKEEGSWSDATKDIEELFEWGDRWEPKLQTPFDLYHNRNPYLKD